MADSFPRKPHIWDRWTATVAADEQAALPERAVLLPFNQAETAERLYATEALYPVHRRKRLEVGSEPYSLQWFLDIENQRHSRQGRWIPRLLEFAKHSGETLLGLGTGLGTDWLQYARHGAAVVVCSSSAEQLTLIRRNFDLRGLRGRFLHAAPASLPIESASIDVVCASSFPAEMSEAHQLMDEVYRVLKPGGKILAVAPARYDVDYWFRKLFPWQRWFGHAPSADAGSSLRFSSRSLRRLCTRFVEHRVHKRQLRRSEVPHLWRWLPLPVLERLMGRCLVLKAFKPLSAAMPMLLAA